MTPVKDIGICDIVLEAHIMNIDILTNVSAPERIMQKDIEILSSPIKTPTMPLLRTHGEI